MSALACARQVEKVLSRINARSALLTIRELPRRDMFQASGVRRQWSALMSIRGPQSSIDTDFKTVPRRSLQHRSMVDSGSARLNQEVERDNAKA